MIEYGPNWIVSPKRSRNKRIVKKVNNKRPEMAKLSTLSPELMTSASFMSCVRFRPTMECKMMEIRMYTATMFKKGS